MSNLCPSDTYRVYKRGLNVRIDTTLLGFDERNWQHGNRSYIFKGDNSRENEVATLIELDHDARLVSVEQMRSVDRKDIKGIPPPKAAVVSRLNAPITSNNVDIDKISFERNKCGVWGWRSEKNETINGFDCKVFGASNVEFVTRTRTEHMNEDQIRLRNSRTPLQSFLGIAQDEEEAATASASSVVVSGGGPTTEVVQEGATADPDVETTKVVPLTAQQYFSMDHLDRDIGRPMKLNSKVQKFKANLWLSEQFPIKLQEQVLPILDLMSAMASPHVNKLKDFITMQLPAGFPVKIGNYIVLRVID